MYRVFFSLLFVLFLSACNLVVPTIAPDDARSAEVETISKSALLRFTIENLGEVSPGFVYRSRSPWSGLLRYLAEEKKLTAIVNLRHNVDPEAKAFIESRGGEYVHLRMSASTPPTPGQILELIRVTHRTRERGGSLLIHCRAGADRTSAMVAIWRMLFQGVTDREILKSETWYYRHQRLFVPMVYQTIERFRPELFRPFVENPAFLDDPSRIADLKSRYFQEQPLLSGHRGVFSGALEVGVAKSNLLEGWVGPIPMATYGMFPAPAKRVRDPVFARAMVLDNGSIRLGLVSCDLLIIHRELREAVWRRAQERGLELDDLLLTATHTHTSVGSFVPHPIAKFYMLGAFKKDFFEHLSERIFEALTEAAKLEPARLGIGRSRVKGINMNRRIGTTVDEDLTVIKVTGADDATRAVIVNFTGHPILAPNDGSISADYPGELTRRLDESHGFGFFLQGSLGDINACAPGRERAWVEEGLADAVAGRLYEEAARVVDTIEVRKEIALGGMTQLFELPRFNVNILPDLFFPFEWLLKALMPWPKRIPLQAFVVGDAAIIACATELGVRPGRQIKLRSPAPYPMMVVHANDYGGYAVGQFLHAKSKLDPTSSMMNNGPDHGAGIVESACDLMEAQWGRRIEVSELNLSQEERDELLLDADPTLPQSRVTGRDGGDSLADRVRLELSYHYLENRRGGQGIEGRRREARAQLRLGLPGELRLGARLSHVRSDWEAPGGRDSDEGPSDLFLELERPFELWEDRLPGNALRTIPALVSSLPTGDSEPDAPFSLAVATGVWRPGVRNTLEFNWNTYRTLTLDTAYLSSTGRYRGRRPGDLLDLGLGYRERHGFATLSMDLSTRLLWPDRRRGGRLRVDVDEFSWEMGLEPGLSFHLGEQLELFTRFPFPVARSGGVGAGHGVSAGVQLSF